MPNRNRELYSNADEDMVAEFGRLIDLFEQASHSARGDFRQLMNEASAQGLTWVEGLEYVIARRRKIN